MRCPTCKNVASWSFFDDVNEQNVYQCRTVGVQTQRTIGQRTHLIYTLDHTDHFFVRTLDGETARVKPVRLSGEQSKMLFKSRKGFVPERGEDGKKVWPVAWGTVVA